MYAFYRLQTAVITRLPASVRIIMRLSDCVRTYFPVQKAVLHTRNVLCMRILGLPESLFPLHHYHLLIIMSSRALHSTLSEGEESSRHHAEELWKQALENYKQETGRNLLGEPFAEDLLSKSSVDEVTERLKKFRGFRDHGHKILRVLKPIVSVVLRFIDAGAEGASVRICLCYLVDERCLTT